MVLDKSGLQELAVALIDAAQSMITSSAPAGNSKWGDVWDGGGDLNK